MNILNMLKNWSTTRKAMQKEIVDLKERNKILSERTGGYFVQKSRADVLELDCNILKGELKLIRSALSNDEKFKEIEKYLKMKEEDRLPWHRNGLGAPTKAQASALSRAAAASLAAMASKVF